MNNRISDDPDNLERECEAWDWARAAGVSSGELRDVLAAGPKDAPRRRRSDAGGGGTEGVMVRRD